MGSRITQVHMKSGEVKVISLAEYGTAGYRWDLSRTDQGLSVTPLEDTVRATTDEVGNMLIGGHVMRRFHLTATAPGTHVFYMSRPWMGTQANEDPKLEVHVT